MIEAVFAAGLVIGLLLGGWASWYDGVRQGRREAGIEGIKIIRALRQVSVEDQEARGRW